MAANAGNSCVWKKNSTNYRVAARREAPSSSICMSNVGPGTKTNPPHAASASLPGRLPAAARATINPLFWGSVSKQAPSLLCCKHPPEGDDFWAGRQHVARPAPSRSNAQNTDGYLGPPASGLQLNRHGGRKYGPNEVKNLPCLWDFIVPSCMHCSHCR